MENILKKQFLLTGYLEYLMTHYFGGSESILADAPTATIITPGDVTQRGCQLSLKFSYPLKHIHRELQKKGVVVCPFFYHMILKCNYICHSVYM